MIKDGLVFKNTKGNPCVILKVDDKYCWVFAKTRQGFNCNHYGKWYIEECLVKENYLVLANYETWQKAITLYFSDRTEDLSQIANMELRDQLEIKEQMIKELKEKLEIAIGDLHWIKEHSDKFDSSCSVEEQLDNIKSQCFATLFYLEE